MSKSHLNCLINQASKSRRGARLEWQVSSGSFPRFGLHWSPGALSSQEGELEAAKIFEVEPKSEPTSREVHRREAEEALFGRSLEKRSGLGKQNWPNYPLLTLIFRAKPANSSLPPTTCSAPPNAWDITTSMENWMRKCAGPSWTQSSTNWTDWWSSTQASSWPRTTIRWRVRCPSMASRWCKESILIWTWSSWARLISSWPIAFLPFPPSPSENAGWQGCQLGFGTFRPWTWRKSTIQENCEAN